MHTLVLQGVSIDHPRHMVGHAHPASEMDIGLLGRSRITSSSSRGDRVPNIGKCEGREIVVLSTSGLLQRKSNEAPIKNASYDL